MIARDRRTPFAQALVGVSIPRLYAYHRALRQELAAGTSTITSRELAATLGHTIASTQIRKDLCALGTLGRRGQGYQIAPLVDQLSWVLGLERDWRIAVVGFGFLGHAFATFIAARESRFHIVAIFDRSRNVIGQSWQGITVSDIADATRIIPNTGCEIGVIAVPAEAAQDCADLLAMLRIRAILNFAPVLLHLHSPADAPPVIVRNIDLAGELSILTHRLSAVSLSVEEA
jgi:redox-sensing transcriptional repressor